MKLCQYKIQYETIHFSKKFKRQAKKVLCYVRKSVRNEGQCDAVMNILFGDLLQV